MNQEDESSIGEITILPDGRVYLFGASREILEALASIPLGDPALAERVNVLHAVGTQAASEGRAENPSSHGGNGTTIIGTEMAS